MKSSKHGSPVVLVIAFACVPGRGSEPGVGWETARAAGAWAALTGVRPVVVTRSVGREAIEKARDDYPELADVRWSYLDLPDSVVRFLGGRASRAYFFAWQVLVLLRCARFRRHLSIVHLVTYATDAVPPVALWVGAQRTRIWGPIGSSRVPWLQQRLRARLVSQWKRRVIRSFGCRVRKLLLQNHHVLKRIAGVSVDAQVRPNIIVDLDVMLPRPGNLRQFPKQLVTVGNLLPGKRVDLSIRLLGQLPEDVGLVVIGHGASLPELECLVAELGLQARVKFEGVLSRTHTVDYIRQSDVLVHPSEHESAGWVVGEALTVGTPAVVFRGSGADTVVELSGHGTIVDRPDLEQLSTEVMRALEHRDVQSVSRWSRERWWSDLGSIYDSVSTSS